MNDSCGCVVRVWQGIDGAKSVILLTHDVDDEYGWRRGLFTLKAEEDKRGVVSTWYFQPDSLEYALDTRIALLAEEGFEVGLHGTDSYMDSSEMIREADVIKSFCPTGYVIETERQHLLRRLRLKDLNEEAPTTILLEAEAGFISSSTLPAYSKDGSSSSGVKCYLPYYGVYWDAQKRSFVELPLLIIPLLLQDVSVERVMLDKMTSALNFHLAIRRPLHAFVKLVELIFKKSFEKRILEDWIKIFDYCYEKSVPFYLLTHPNSVWKDGTGSPGRARNIYGRFIDYMLSKGRVHFTTPAAYARWWSARRKVMKDLVVSSDRSGNSITIEIPKVEESGIGLLIDLPSGSRINASMMNGEKMDPSFKEGYGVIVMLPRSDEKSVVEVSYTSHSPLVS